MAVLTGAAGTGKSLVIKHLKRRGATVCATTGKAAINVAGCTIDKLFSIDRQKWMVRSMDRLAQNMAGCSNVIVIDEASMVGMRMADLVAEAAQRFDKKLIFVGDWGQAKPVKDEWPTRSRAFAAATFVKMNQCHRQADGEYLHALNRVRVGQFTPADAVLFSSRTSHMPPPRDFPGICIYATNKAVDAYNNACLEEHCKASGAEAVWVEATLRDERDPYIKETYPLDQGAHDRAIDDSSLAHMTNFAVGCKVVVTRNIEDCAVVNGDIGFVTSIDPGHIGLRVTRAGVDMPIDIPRCAVDIYSASGRVEYVVEGFPLRLGYGVTIHKSQGMTVDSAWVDFASICHHPTGSRHGLAYVALSRTRTLEGLQISGWDDDAIEIDEEIRPWL
jgi:ATP-dependent exoDNAse (exonuclease V) alpha subunit